MIAAAPNCLTDRQLESLLRGDLSPDEFESAVAHIDGCAACQKATETDRFRPSRDGFLGTDDPNELSVDTACQIAMGRLLSDSGVADAADLPEKSQQLGPYRLLGTIGRGGMGTVCLAQHERLQRHCAIKILPRHRVLDPGWLDRFDREMQTVAALEHPHIVRATDAGHEDGWHYLVMEYLDGLDLAVIAARLKRIATAEACEVIRQSALALSHVHESGLVHRDIKPSNLMLCHDGTVKLLDLGLVLPGDDPLATDDRLTTVGHVMGTMPYMAPEQLMDCRRVEPAADVYALGATLYRLISGNVPHPGRRGLAAQVMAITGEAPPRLDDQTPGVDRRLADFVDTMLHRDPDRRPSAAAVAEALPNWSTDADLSHLIREARKHPDAPEPAPRAFPEPAASGNPPRRRRRRWIAGGFFAAAVLIAAVIVKLQTEKGELIIESEAVDATVLIKQGDELVERLEITRAGDNRFLLRQGTYAVEIDGANDGLRLSSGRVRITRGQPTELELDGAAGESVDAPRTDGGNEDKLYQGRPLTHWLDVLAREQDVRAIGNAMGAVEILSRDTNSREQAAEMTLDLAKRLGGLIVEGTGEGFMMGGDGSASGRFMGYLLEVFPGYFPEPGLELVRRELNDGNRQSRIASIFLLSNFLDGVRGNVADPSSERNARATVEAWSTGTPSQRSLVRGLVEGLGDSAMQLGRRTDPEDQSAAQQAFATALELLTVTRDTVPAPDWLPDFVRERATAAQKKFAAFGPGDGGTSPFGGPPAWLLSPGLFEAALEMHREGRLELNPNFVAATVTYPHYHWKDSGEAVRRAVEMSPETRQALRSHLRSRIAQIVATAPAAGEAVMGIEGYEGMRMGGNLGMDPRLYFRGKTAYWKASFDLLAEDTETVGRSLPVLRDLRDAKLGDSSDGIVPDELLPSLEEAIETLQQRLEQTP